MGNHKIKVVCFLASIVSTYAFNFLTVGDWGADPYRTSVEDYGRDDQIEVAARMDEWCDGMDCKFVVSLGDNFYNDGLETVDDPRFEDAWKDIYTGPNIADLRWYITLGNHDHYYGNGPNQLERASTEDRYYLPNYWYDEYIYHEDASIHLVGIDTDIMKENHFSGDPQLDNDVQMAWLNNVLSSPQNTTDWTIVFAHHPIKTCGGYAPGDGDLEALGLEDILNNNNVDLYMNGHDHNLQHLWNIDYTFDILLSGGGGRGHYGFDNNGCRQLEDEGWNSYFDMIYGFTSLEITRHNLTATYYGKDNLDLRFWFTMHK